MDLAKKKFNEHKSSAKRRGIEFTISFEQWKEVWGDKLDQRAGRAGQLGMLRTRDEGGYSVGNVRLGTPRENRQEHVVSLRVKRSPFPAARNYISSNAELVGWTSRNRVFDEYVEDEDDEY